MFTKGFAKHSLAKCNLSEIGSSSASLLLLQRRDNNSEIEFAHLSEFEYCFQFVRGAAKNSINWTTQ